jgi:uncharacterized membrane protein YhaH (DUF805 family)
MSRFLQNAPFSFKGRASRKRYWLLTLAYLLTYMLGCALFVTLAIVVDAKTSDAITPVIAGVVVLLIIILAWASSAIAVRRLHDRGKTGYWLLLYYAAPAVISANAGLDAAGLIFLAISLALAIWALIDLGILRGEVGSNAFGADPLSPESVPALATA